MKEGKTKIPEKVTQVRNAVTDDIVSASGSNELLSSKQIKVTVVAEISFEIDGDNYVDAFDEAVRSIEINHKGYKWATYR